MQLLQNISYHTGIISYQDKAAESTSCLHTGMKYIQNIKHIKHRNVWKTGKSLVVS